MGYNKCETIEELHETEPYKELTTEVENRKAKILQKNEGGNFGTCPKCKQNSNSLVVMQTRSSDEPISFIVVCNNCGTKWDAK